MKEVSVAVDGEEARISFVDHMHGEMSVMMIMMMKIAMMNMMKMMMLPMLMMMNMILL